MHGGNSTLRDKNESLHHGSSTGAISTTREVILTIFKIGERFNILGARFYNDKYCYKLISK